MTTPKHTLDDFASFNYEPKDYLIHLQETLGHYIKHDPSPLSNAELVKLGKAVLAEFKRLDVKNTKEMCDINAQMVIQKIEKAVEQSTNPKDAEDYAVQKEFVDKTVGKIDTIGYTTQMGMGVQGRQQHIELRAEMYFQLSEIREIPNHYEGIFKTLWTEYYTEACKRVHYWQEHETTVGRWLTELQGEYGKRQPGYVAPPEPTGFENMTAEDFWTDDDEANEPEMTDADMHIDHLEEILREYQASASVMSIRYDRLERIALGEVEASKEEILKMRTDHQNITSNKYVNNASWKWNDKENIRLLTQVAKPEGHSFPIHFRGNNHFKRNLCLRYGINITNRESIVFNCTRLAWANNYWGTIRGFEDKSEVIISLWVNRQNKGEGEVPDFFSDEAWDYFFDAKTTVIAKQHGDEFLALERKYAPLSADFTGYHVEQLLEQHKLIMGELNKD